jgi:hypothetical protein
MIQDAEGRRKKFFQLLFGNNAGYVCLAFKTPGRKGLREEFYQYPEQIDLMIDTIEKKYIVNDAYFCPMLLRSPRRSKETVLSCPAAWADLDECEPEHMLVQPSIVIETSEQRYQALWLFEELQEPELAEALSRRIAYYHAEEGADRSGWDLSQLLRIPLTNNLKYSNQSVIINSARNIKYRIDDFEQYPVPEELTYTNVPFPTPEELEGLTPEAVFDKYAARLTPLVYRMYTIPPSNDTPEGWSGELWKLYMMLYEAGATPVEAFVVTREAACNKFKRDGRPDKYLWMDVCKAHIRHNINKTLLIPTGEKADDLITAEETKMVETNPGFVERYITWAKSLGDAAWQYHQAGAFIILSSLLSGAVKLPTSFGTISPNMWFMILADTTLTRKSTAMDIAMDLVADIDSDTLLATDGSLEGLLTALSTRPNRPSVFLRDEFSGLLESMTKKDYNAGMAEVFTKLYDGKTQKRILRKEQIDIKDPVFIMFAGGIRSKITSLLTHEQVASGFFPRFVLITAESDLTKVKPLGPPTETIDNGRNEIMTEVRRMSSHYLTEQLVTLPSGAKVAQQVRWDAHLSPQAWTRYNLLEATLLQEGLRHKSPDLMTPTMDRLAKSALKASVLLAASRQVGHNKVLVEEEDVVRACYYVQQWRGYANMILSEIGESADERELGRVLAAIQRKPGISRSTVMNYFHLTSRNVGYVVETLEQRGLITITKNGRGQTFFPTTE